MGLKKLEGRLSDYNARLEQGKTDRIKPDHVEKVIGKLNRKVARLEAEAASADDPDKKARLERKLGVAREHVARAEWLLTQIQ